ncbi:uncharacterized protein LOC110999289 isoform X2 [Pieris rapae]|uniref:uncharacterized protein LOC110999289 isoform X2 n=1 Tax=Pieris rapae TaxID=64459 RepID=UPI001E280458|nr:uncharacterized protein LOC110999289 isoform X2 [Pieris rapae]
MDRLKQKLRKSSNAKEKYVADVMCIKENIKIREILRNVKMNSSMRLKAPTGSKVMNNTDYSDSEDFDGRLKNENEIFQPPYAMNHDVILLYPEYASAPSNLNEPTNHESHRTLERLRSNSEANLSNSLKNVCHFENNKLVKLEPVKRSESMIPDTRCISEILHTSLRTRKMSLDQSVLDRRFTQSELDLHSVGKLPLERKSSFFRKKMGSFFRNTAHLFKKKSLMNNNSTTSLQFLDENDLGNDEEIEKDYSQLPSPIAGCKSETSLISDSTVTSTSSNAVQKDQSLNMSPENSTSTVSTQNMSNSILSLNEEYIQEAMLTPRAISMSSGLDSTSDRCGRKFKANRVTWLASEGLTNYFRRVIQDEKSKEKHKTFHSHQDFSSIPENESYVSSLNMGRRLSYQRAVFGEDPVSSIKYQDSLTRRKHISNDKIQAHLELQNHLAEFSNSGVPSLQGFIPAAIPENSFSYLMWSEQSGNLELACDWKTLDENEQKKQAVVRELVETEANYIQHLMVIVEVFIAAAHSLQDSGKMLDVDTAKLFSNIPDLLNANLVFWNITFYPMVKDAVENKTPYKVELMADGFSHFHEIFQPYEKYMSEQAKMMTYLRFMQNDPEFSLYLNWCYTNKSCNRLQLSDLLVKPMQRLTKYSLILRRVVAYAKTNEESVTLKSMENFVRGYVIDLNRSMRQRDELEKLDEILNSVEPYELEFKDEEMERAFRTYCSLNLKTTVQNSTELPLRNLVYECNLRFKDNIGKESEIKLFLLTDVMLICKKQSKGSALPYKMIRPKIFLERLVSWHKSAKSQSQSNSLIYVIVDETNSAIGCFTLSESTKDSTPSQTLKTLEIKIKEARLSHSLLIWAALNPSRDLSEIESSDTCTMKVKNAEDIAIENEARERVACMLHRGMGVSTDECSQSFTTDSNEAAGDVASYSRIGNQRHYMHRLSTASSRQSRLSSFQQSLSATSRDEPHPGPSKIINRAGGSLEQPVTSITVNLVSETETPTEQEPLVADGLTLHVTPAPESPHSLSPHSNNVSVLSSHPDLNPNAITLTLRAPSASERLYQSHQELLQRNRLAASQSSQFLSPDHRGSSYPPPSPTRASLKRGLAFSYSFKNPPLSKMGNVHSQSHVDAAMYASQGHLERQPSPSTVEKSDKKHKDLTTRNKATSITDPEESAVSSTVPTYPSVQENISENETHRGDDGSR